MQESAPESASDVARELRALAQSLKESFKKNDVLNKDVEFKRKSLRKLQLKLLLLYPTSKDAKDAETHLWMQTSYQFIAAYKQRIAVLDRKLFAPPGPNTRDGEKRERDRDRNGGGHVEYRKLLMRFRQFLAEEERFYTQLLVRFQSQFALGEAARGVLVRAEILQASATCLSAPTSPISAHGEYTSDEPPAPRTETERNLFPEPRDMPPRSEKEREVRLTAFTKLLVCLGDIARYREQYNDGGGRPRAGHEEGAPRRGRRGARGSNNHGIARPRDYRRAQTIYEQARMLLPDDGNASHQLAILAAYKNDTFAALLHYYRALCIRHPYDTASDNLNVVLKKALDQYKAAKNAGEGKDEETPQVGKLRLDRFKEWVVILHGLWYLDSDSNATKASKQARLVLEEYRTLLTDRILPIPTILDVFTLSVAALWKLRMIRDKKMRADTTTVVPHVAAHVLGLARTLLTLGATQLAEGRREETRNVSGDSLSEDLAQRITAIFRRTVPALRIMSKWLRSNIGYLHAEGSSSSAHFTKELGEFWRMYAEFSSAMAEAFPLAKLPMLRGPLDEDIEVTGFSAIKRGLLHGPAATVSGLAPGQDEVHPNEEYLMRIHDLLEDAKEIASDKKSPIAFENGCYVVVKGQKNIKNTNAVVHEGLTESAHLLSEANGDEQGVTNMDDLRAMPPEQPASDAGDDDDNMTQATRTDDDVIREAFDTALDISGMAGDDDEDDGDEIIWSPPKEFKSLYQTSVNDGMSHQYQHPFPPMDAQTSTSVAPDAIMRQVSPPTPMHPHPEQPVSKADLKLSPHSRASFSQQQVSSANLGGSTTAQDLLNNVLGVRFGSRPPTHQSTNSDFAIDVNVGAASKHFGLGAGQHGPTSTAPQAPMLFGTGSPNMATKSIWSSTNGGDANPHYNSAGAGTAAAPIRGASMPMQSPSLGAGLNMGLPSAPSVPNPSLAPGHGRSLSGSGQSWPAAESRMNVPSRPVKQQTFTSGGFGAVGQHSQLHLPQAQHHQQNGMLGFNGNHQLHVQAPIQQSLSMPSSDFAMMQKAVPSQAQVVYDTRLPLGNGSNNSFGLLQEQAQSTGFGAYSHNQSGFGAGIPLGFGGHVLNMNHSDDIGSKGQLNNYYDMRGSGLARGHNLDLNNPGTNINGLGGLGAATASGHPGPSAYRRSIWET